MLSQYEQLATYYDHLFDRAAGVSRARQALIGDLLPAVTSACDLACGTGNLVVHLARRGIDVVGVDNSREMCRLAERKAVDNGMRVQIMHADMRSFKLPKPVDLVTCEFDALNHVPRKSDLLRVFRSVHRALKQGGYFAFDVNNRLAFERIWARTWFLDKDPVSLVMQGAHDRGSDVAMVELVWFIRSDHGLWQRHTESVREVCWSQAEIRAALKEAGLTPLRTLDAAPLFRDELTQPGNRTYWLTQKPTRRAPARKALPASKRPSRSPEVR